MYWGFTILFIVILQLITREVSGLDVAFDDNYQVTWGKDHFDSLNHGREVQLSLDKASGSGFASKTSYGSGFFSMRIKLHNKDSAGVVTAFYLSSNSAHHDELDFEFLGNKENKPYILQTNIYVNGVGGREQRFSLWFDPAADFHTYKILWNEHQIVFYVDDVPIRVMKNRTNEGITYPSQPMQVEGSIWDGDSWATDGGRTKTNWSNGPFKAYFQGFLINGCPSNVAVMWPNVTPLTSDYRDDYWLATEDVSMKSSNVYHCYASKYWWNANRFWDLDNVEKVKYKEVRKEYMNYDYCTDKNRNVVPPPECLLPFGDRPFG